MVRRSGSRAAGRLRYRRRLREQTALTRAALALGEPVELAAVLELICREAVGVLGAGKACVYRTEGDGSTTVVGAYRMPAHTMGYRSDPGVGVAGRVANEGHALAVEDLQAVTPMPESSPFADVHGCLAVPLRWGTTVRGVLCVGFPDRDGFDRRALALLDQFARFAELAMRNAVLQQALAEAARTDPLTGCRNRTGLDEALTVLAGAAEGAAVSHPGALLLLDLDDFKAVNDQRGHRAGDDLLRVVGQVLRESVRHGDVVARYGGDEFAILAMGADTATAVALGRRLLAALRRVSVAATVGVCRGEPGMDGDTLLRHADRALLTGKSSARKGQVLVFPAGFAGVAAPAHT